MNKIVNFGQRLVYFLFMHEFKKQVGFLFFAIGLLSCSQKQYLVQKNKSQVISINSSIYIDSLYFNIIKPYKEKLDNRMSQIIGTFTRSVYRDSAAHELVGWMADVLLYEAQKNTSQSIDFAIMNGEGVRIPVLSKGPITIGKTYELMPFENETAVLTLDGHVMKELFMYLATARQAHNFNAAHARIIFKNKQIIEATIAGSPFDSTKVYRLAISDYLALGGDDMVFFNRAIKKEFLKLKIRDGVIDYINEQTAQGKLIEVHNSGSIRRD